MEEGTIPFYKKPSFIFPALIPVLLIVFRYIIGFNGLYGQDSYEYLAYSRLAHDFFLKGMIPHSFHWPIMYPVPGAILSFVFSSALAMQIISIAAFSGALYFIYKIISLLYPGAKNSLGYVLVFGML